MTPTQERKSGLMSLHASVLIFGGTALFAKFIELDSVWITWGRSLVAGLLLFGIAYGMGKWKKVTGAQQWGLWLLSASLLGAHWVTYFHSMQVSGIAIGMISLYTYPLITVFLEPWFTREKVDYHDFLAAVFVLMGIAFIVPEFSFDNDVSQGVFWGAISALFFSLRNLIQRYKLSGYSVKQSISIQTLVIFVLLSPYIFIDWSAKQDLISKQDLWLMLCLGMIFTALPHSLFANSLKYLTAKTVSLIGCLQPVYGAILAYLIFSESITWSTFFGGLIIISTAAYESIRSR